MTAISVAIPTWQPNPEFLQMAVRSVLKQAGDGISLSIELIDDASPDFDVESFARGFGSSRISWHRNPSRLGMAGNWNQCIVRSEAEWVHILHQDDCVLDGFYAAIGQGLESGLPIAAAFCASNYLDAENRAWNPRLVRQPRPGILEDWQQHVFVNLAIQCSAIVVRRDVYQALGGFDPALRYTLDWELWKRMVVMHPVWFEPQALACFRMHSRSETTRQRSSGEHLEEIFRSIEQTAELLPEKDVKEVTRRARRHYASFAVEEAAKSIFSYRDWRGAGRALAIARQNTSFFGLVAAIIKVMLRGLLRPFLNRRVKLALP